MITKKRIFEILEAPKPGDLHSRVFDLLMLTLIFLNVLAMMAETVEPLGEDYKLYFWYFEVFSVAVFSIEYALRIWSCTESNHYPEPVMGRLHYMATPMLLIDLAAILPFYLPFLGLDLRFLRSLRLLRIFRIIRVGRYSIATKVMTRVIKHKKEELLSSIFLLLILLISASSLMYFAEHDAQPDKFANIPESMWWGVITLTSIGYGDVVPVTSAGKVIGAIIALLGLGMIALPTAILGAGFVEEVDRRKKRKDQKCPHCGKMIEH